MKTIYDDWCQEDLIAELGKRDDHIESLLRQLRKAGEDIRDKNEAMRQEDIRSAQSQIMSDLYRLPRP